MWYWHGMGAWGWLMMVAFWVVVILLIMWATTASRQRDEDGPLRMLEERLAGGEIDREYYEERRRVLESHR